VRGGGNVPPVFLYRKIDFGYYVEEGLIKIETFSKWLFGWCKDIK
jgi:hypothetical protein